MNEKPVEAKAPLCVLYCRDCHLIWLPDKFSTDLKAFYETYGRCPRGHDKVSMRITVAPQKTVEELLYWPS